MSMKLPLLLVSLVTALGLAATAGRPQRVEAKSTIRELSNLSIQALRDEFNRSATAVRILAIMSPT